MVDYSKYLKMGDNNPNIDAPTVNNTDMPEDDFFHSIYIAGKTRIDEKLNNKKIISGFLQIRGIEYNLDEVYMMPYYKRQILIKNEKIGRYTSPVCFSFYDFDENNNQISTCGFPCPPSSDLRQEIPWCAPCRTSIILAGFLCDSNGKIIKDDEGNPYNVFLRGTGSKVGDIMKYIFDTQQYEVPYLFPDGDEELTKKEILYFNIFRYIIKITVGNEEVFINRNKTYDIDVNSISKTRYSYVLEPVIELQPDNIFKLIDYAEKINDKIRDKFDLSDLAKKNIKKISNKLAAFQNSDLYRQAVPNFKHENSNSEFVFETSKINMANQNKFNIDLPSSANSNENNNDDINNNDNNKSDIDDIPF